MNYPTEKLGNHIQVLSGFAFKSKNYAKFLCNIELYPLKCLKLTRKKKSIISRCFMII